MISWLFFACTVATEDSAVVPLDPTLTNVQAEVFNKSCAFSTCHGVSGASAGLSLVDGVSYLELINIPAEGDAETGVPLKEGGDTGTDSGDTGTDSGDTGTDSGDTGDTGDTGDSGDAPNPFAQIRVVPGDVASSYLINKLEASEDIVGERMPEAAALDETRLALVRDWVERGALDD